MQKTPLCAFLSLVFAVSTVHAATAPMVDGVSNGVSTKYNKNCLDVAYKNAYEEADGKKTDSSTFPNYKCYKDGKEIYCNEVREDGQTENAKTDHFVNQLPDGLSCVGIPESQKVYEGSVVSCDDVAYKNGYCKASGVSPCDLSGFKCYRDRVATACSDVTDDAQNDKAEADYLENFWKQVAADRSYIFEFTDEYRNVHDNTYRDWYGHWWSWETSTMTETIDGKLSLSETLINRLDFGWQENNMTVRLSPELIGCTPSSIKVTINGVTKTLTRAGKHWNDDYSYIISGDVFNLKNLVGQKITATVSW